MLVFLFGSSILRGGYGASRGRVGCRVGGIGARSSAVWGAKLGSDGSPRRGRRVKGQSRGHRLARDPSGTLSNPSIGKSDEPENRFPVFRPLWKPGKRRLVLGGGRRSVVRT